MARDMPQTTEEFSEVADNTSATRAKWIAELRRQGHRQCHDALTLHESVCALGLLAEVAGLPLNHSLDFPELIAATGMSEAQLTEIIRRNDGNFPYRRRQTFAKIADVVEGWFR